MGRYVYGGVLGWEETDLENSLTGGLKPRGTRLFHFMVVTKTTTLSGIEDRSVT